MTYEIWRLGPGDALHYCGIVEAASEDEALMWARLIYASDEGQVFDAVKQREKVPA